MKEYLANEAARITGLSTATLRYYEADGILGEIARNEQGNRVYSERNIEHIQMIQCMRNAHVPMADIRKYVKLYFQGDFTIPERMEMMEEYQKRLEDERIAIEQAYHLTELKLGFYKERMEGRRSTLSEMEEWEKYLLEKE